MSSIGKVATTGAYCGYALIALATDLLTKSGQAALLVGLLFGLPTGMLSGIFTAIALSRERNKTDTVFWIAVAVVLIVYLAVLAAIMFFNATNAQ